MRKEAKFSALSASSWSETGTWWWWVLRVAGEGTELGVWGFSRTPPASSSCSTDLANASSPAWKSQLIGTRGFRERLTTQEGGCGFAWLQKASAQRWLSEVQWFHVNVARCSGQKHPGAFDFTHVLTSGWRKVLFGAHTHMQLLWGLVDLVLSFQSAFSTLIQKQMMSPTFMWWQWKLVRTWGTVLRESLNYQIFLENRNHVLLVAVRAFGCAERAVTACAQTWAVPRTISFICCKAHTLWRGMAAPTS